MKFKQGNELIYGQNFEVCKGIPPTVDFTVEMIGDDRFKLTASGYGLMGDFGKGAIYMTPPNRRMRRQLVREARR